MSFPWWRRRRHPVAAAAAQETPVSPASPPLPPRRRYLNDTNYPLPKDEGERRRLDFQHHALSFTLGNHYLAPLSPRVRSILDVGTGTGIWPQEMARLFPEALVLGVDIDTELFGKSLPANCLLRQGNVLSGLPLPDAIFEYTHQRFLVLAIPDEQWPQVVRELVRVTRPGGWLEVVETDARVQQGGPATTRMMAWLDEVRAARGLRGEAVRHLGELLHQERMGEVVTQDLSLPVGAWGGRAGQMMEADILAAVQALQEPCAANGVAPQEYEACVQAMASQWQQAQAFCRVQVAYGRRPAP